MISYKRWQERASTLPPERVEAIERRVKAMGYIPDSHAFFTRCIAEASDVTR